MTIRPASATALLLLEGKVYQVTSKGVLVAADSLAQQAQPKLEELKRQADAADKLAEKESAGQSKLVVGGLTAGSGLAWQAFTLGNTTNVTQVSGVLRQCNLTPQAADSAARAVLDFVDSTLGKAAALGAATAAGTYAVLSVAKPSWSWKKRLGVSVAAAALLIALFLLAKWGGVMK